MAKLRPLGTNNGVVKSFATEDGAHYRHWRQDMDPVLKHVEHMRHKVNEAPTTGNKSGWKHEGSVPISLVVDWCNRNGYQFEEWARNEGGQRGVHWRNGQGVKDKFMRYFKSREFSKLHNDHVTTKVGTTVFQVPKSIQRQAVDIDIGV